MGGNRANNTCANAFWRSVPVSFLQGFCSGVSCFSCGWPMLPILIRPRSDLQKTLQCRKIAFCLPSICIFGLVAHTTKHDSTCDLGSCLLETGYHRSLSRHWQHHCVFSLGLNYRQGEKGHLAANKAPCSAVQAWDEICLQDISSCLRTHGSCLDTSVAESWRQQEAGFDSVENGDSYSHCWSLNVYLLYCVSMGQGFILCIL